jgi:hypothetical protein
VADGEGYIVRVDAPETWEAVPVDAVGALTKTRQGLLLVSGPRDLCAYGTDGLRWVITTLSLSDLRIDGVHGDQISGTAWNPADHSRLPFTINALTGEVVGGWREARLRSREIGAREWPHTRW